MAEPRAPARRAAAPADGRPAEEAPSRRTPGFREPDNAAREAPSHQACGFSEVSECGVEGFTSNTDVLLLGSPSTAGVMTIWTLPSRSFLAGGQSKYRMLNRLI